MNKCLQWRYDELVDQYIALLAMMEEEVSDKSLRVRIANHVESIIQFAQEAAASAAICKSRTERFDAANRLNDILHKYAQ